MSVPTAAGAASRYAVVILNWNGADDTIACLRSVLAGAARACPIVVDNGSADDSLARIDAGLRALGRPPWRCSAAGAPTAPAAAGAMLIEAGENLGYAAGCNLGLRAAQALDCPVTVLLNNDTVVEAGALSRIVERLWRDPGCFVCLPMLTVHGTDRIWNCGGTVHAIGLRRYFLAGRCRADGVARGEIACSFFTGCCFAIRTADFAARGGWSERFFFGEEDFELALWMKERRLRAVCLTSAVVEHKVSVAFRAAAGARDNARVHVYYLNRFIHMRLRLGRCRWALWLAAYLPYVTWLLWRRRSLPLSGLWRVLRRLVALASRMDGVRRADFEALMAGRSGL